MTRNLGDIKMLKVYLGEVSIKSDQISD